MTLQRSNVRAFSNVTARTPDLDARSDSQYRQHVRTRSAIFALFPFVRAAYGIDWAVARGSLSEFQCLVLQDHHACPMCQRWDRWPVFVDGRWSLSRTPLGCRCTREETVGMDADKVAD